MPLYRLCHSEYSLTYYSIMSFALRFETPVERQVMRYCHAGYFHVRLVVAPRRLANIGHSFLKTDCDL